MKFKFILILITILSTNLFSQDISFNKNSLKTGINYAFFGAGDIIGIAFYSDYTYNINKYLGISPKISFGDGYRSNLEETLNYTLKETGHISIKSLSISSKYIPFPFKFKRLSCEMGLHISIFNKTSGTYFSNFLYETSNTTFNNYSEFQFGFIGSLKLNIIEKENFFMGVNLELLTQLYERYLEATSYQYGIYCGIRF
jgi:hypothetical protein